MEPLQQLFIFLKNQFRDGFFWIRFSNKEEDKIVKPIVKSVDEISQTLWDIDDDKRRRSSESNNQVVESLDKIGEIISSQKFPEMPKEIVVSNLQSIITLLGDAVKQKVPEVTVNFDEKRIVLTLEKLYKVLAKEDINYSSILEEIKGVVSGIKLEIDLSKVESSLQEILNKDFYIPIEDDRVKVVLPDDQMQKLGKTIGGFYPTDHAVKDSLGHYINPSTKELQTSILSAIGGISSAGLATSAKQLPDNHNVTVSNIASTPVITGFSTSAKQLPDGHAVAVNNLPTEYALPTAQVTTLTPPAAITGFATSAKQTDASQKTQVVDGSGNVIGATSNALDINIKSGNPTTMPVTNTGTFAVQNTDSVVSATGKTIKVAYTASQTAATVLTPTAGKKVVITDYVISATGQGTVYLFDNTDSATTAITPTLSLPINGGVSKGFKKPWQSSAIDNLIKYTSGANASGSIWLNYYEI